MSDDHSEHSAEEAIIALAAKYDVAYKETETDVFAEHLTRLSGDDVELDEAERLLLALRRAGHISSAERARLHGAYLKYKFE